MSTLAGRLVVGLQDDRGVEQAGVLGRPQQLLVGLAVALVRQVDDGLELRRPRPATVTVAQRSTLERERDAGRRGAGRGRAEPDRDPDAGRAARRAPSAPTGSRPRDTASSQTGCQMPVVRWYQIDVRIGLPVLLAARLRDVERVVLGAHDERTARPAPRGRRCTSKVNGVWPPSCSPTKVPLSQTWQR